MTTKIEINIQQKGSAVGTLGWLNSKLKEAEFTIKNCNNGMPAMFIGFKDENTNKVKYNYVCGLIVNYEDSSFERTRESNGIEYCYAYPIHDDMMGNIGVFKHPLTPAAYEIVDEIIDQCMDRFIEYWENN